MAITRTAIVDDDGTHTTGTVFEDDWKQELYDQIDAAIGARWSEFTTTSTGSQNNFAFSEADTIRANNASALTLTGLLAPSPAKPGKPLRLVAIGAGTVTLNNEDAASTAANRIITGTGAALTLAATTGWALLVYDDTSDRWRVIGSSVAPPATPPSVTTSTLTGAQNNWAPTLSVQTLIEWSGAADAGFTGLAGGATGRLVTIKNTGSFVATFAHNSGSSSAGNKFKNLVTVGATPVAPRGYITYQYDGTDWVQVAHRQGAAIAPAYSGSNFAANGSMTWTVDSGDVITYAYELNGSKLTVWFYLQTTTVGGTVNTQLSIAIPGGFQAARATLWPLTLNDNGGGFAIGFCQTAASGFTITCHKYAGNWTLSTNLTAVYGTLVFEVL